jgi:hypothetical protein
LNKNIFCQNWNARFEQRFFLHQAAQTFEYADH